MAAPVYVETPPPLPVAIPYVEVAIGHTRQLVLGLEFSLSLRGYLHCLATFERGRSWLSLEPGRAPAWLHYVAREAEALLLADPRLVSKAIV